MRIKLLFDPAFENSFSQRHESIGLFSCIFDEELDDAELVQ